MRQILAPAAVAAVVVALGQAGPAVAVLPVLGLLRGPLGAVVVAGGLLVTVGRALGSRVSVALPALTPRNAFLLGIVLYLPLGLWYASRLRVSGDEPHYLLMAQSLWREGDLQVEDNLAREDFLEYTPGPVRPHYGAPRKDGRPYPAHSPGLPALMAPVYALGGRLLCIALLGAMAAGVAASTLALARDLGLGREAEGWAFAAALGPPLLFYSFHVYTEVPSALAIVLALRFVLAPAPSAAAAIGAALCASALPWLHVKMIPAAAALGVLALARLRGRPLAAFAATAAVMAAGYMGYYQSVFGRPTPLALYGGVPTDVAFSPLRALGGLLLDRSFGLWPHAPVFVLLLAFTTAPTVRRVAPAAWGLMGVLVAVILPALSWRMWWGGQCPPARFLVPAIPILALAAGVGAATARGLARWRGPLAAGGFLLALTMTADPGALLLLNRANRPTRVWSSLAGEGVDLGRYLPSLTLADPVETRVAVVWVLVTGTLVALHVLALRRDRIDRLFRSAVLPLLVAAALGIGVDAWARNGEGRPAAGPPPTDETNDSVR